MHFLELERKHKPKVKNQWRTGSGMGGVVRPPLSNNAYENMSIEDWISSFLKYNTERDMGFDLPEEDFLKGGMFEHSGALKQQAKIRPEMFFELLNKIKDREDVPITYFSSCLDGLIEAKFDAVKLYPYFKILISKRLTESETLYSIWKARYFIRNKVFDNDGFTYIVQLALTHPNPSGSSSMNDLLTESLNRIRSSSIEGVISCAYIDEHKSRILDLVEQSSNDNHSCVKVAILHNIVHLIQIDKERSFTIFKKLFETSSDEEVKYCFNSGRYFLFNFHNRMDFLFERIIQCPELHENGGFMIILCWFYNYSGGIKYFDRFIESTNNAKFVAIKLAEDLILDERYRAKSIKILRMLVKEKDKDFASRYSGFVLRKCDMLPFNDMAIFFEEYSKSEVLKFAPNYFLMYLKKQAPIFPNEVLLLINNMDFNTTPNIQFAGHYDKEPIQIIVSIYSELYNRKLKDSKAIKLSLSIFDNMLKIPHLRNTANHALENISQ